jgi:flagellar basal-body rod protein FlgB
MVDPIFQSDNMQLAKKLLDASVLRQNAIASNIANAETPGYRRIDVSSDFATQLKAHLEAGDLADKASSLQPILTEDRTARSSRPDGNNVEVERELLEMNRNGVDYDYLSEVVTYNIKQMRMAVTGKS